MGTYGTKTINGTATNTYVGTWTVYNGTLNLNDSAGVAFGTGANLTVGGPAGVEDVQVLANNQLSGVNLTITAAGTLHLNGQTDFISALTMTGGGTGGILDLGGGILTENGGLTVTGGATGGAQVINGSWQFPGATLWNVTAGGATPDLVVGAGLAGTGNLTIDGLFSTSVVRLLGPSAAHTGSTSMQGGVIVYADGDNSNSDFLPNASSTLRGAGTVSGIDPGVATLSPGDSPGILTTNAGLFEQAATTYAPIINGTTVGTQYAQIHVTGGTVNLNGPLSVALGYSPAVNDAYTIVKNDGGSANIGTFIGLPEGAQFAAGGKVFTITYVGGVSGHDVILKNIPGFSTTTTFSASAPSPTAGQQETFSVTVTSASGPVPTGTVTLLDGGTTVATGTLNGSGQAALVLTPPAGTHTYSVQYGGDGQHTRSTSGVLALTMPGAVVTPVPSAGAATLGAGMAPAGGGLLVAGSAVLLLSKRRRRVGRQT